MRRSRTSCRAPCSTCTQLFYTGLDICFAGHTNSGVLYDAALYVYIEMVRRKEKFDTPLFPVVHIGLVHVSGRKAFFISELKMAAEHCQVGHTGIKWWLNFNLDLTWRGGGGGVLYNYMGIWVFHLRIRLDLWTIIIIIISSSSSPSTSLSCLGGRFPPSFIHQKSSSPNWLRLYLIWNMSKNILYVLALKMASDTDRYHPSPHRYVPMNDLVIWSCMSDSDKEGQDQPPQAN